MPSSGVHAAEAVFLILLVFVVTFGVLAKKLDIPYPIILVIAGLLVSFIPGMPRVTLAPDIIFLVVLPPLLYAAAWQTAWPDFCKNISAILSLAVGLVGFTVLGVAQAANWLFTGFDWRIGFILGAVVCTTDAIAATSIARRVGLRSRALLAVLEGESLVNDATGLLALEFGIAMVVQGQTPTLSYGAMRLAYLVSGGILLGLLLGRVIEWIEHHIDDGPMEIAISIMVPYAAYLGAEAVHSSGVLAVVACGLYLGRKSSQFFSPSVRLQASAVWSSLTFILNGIVFLLIGLQLPQVLVGLQDYTISQLFLYGTIFSGLVVALRLLWSFPAVALGHFVKTQVLHQNECPPNYRAVFTIGWTGMRGVIALAAAMSLPEKLANGNRFEQREMIVFLTFSVILFTLVGQGLTLAPLIRALGLTGEQDGQQESKARYTVMKAALQRLDELREGTEPELAPMFQDLEQHYKSRLSSLEYRQEGVADTTLSEHMKYLETAQELLSTERKTVDLLRQQGTFAHEILLQLELELDLGQIRLEAGGEHP